jgi:hypothetical protein
VPADAKDDHVIEVAFESGPLAGLRNVKHIVVIQ